MTALRMFSPVSGLMDPWDGGTPVIPPDPGGGGSTPPPPPPGGSGMLWGASTSRGQAAWVSTQATAGPWTVSRSFNAGTFEGSWAGSIGAPDVGRCASSLSWKPDMTQMASGALDATVTNLISGIPDSHLCFVEIWHEADVKQRKNALPVDLATFNAAKLRFYTLVKAVGKPHVYTNLILSNYSFITSGITSGRPDSFWVGDTGSSRVIDVVGFDTYMISNTSLGGTHQLAPCVAWADAKGAGAAIPELGLDAAVTDYTAGAAWLTDVATYARTTKCGPHRGFAYTTQFDTGVPPTPSSSPLLISASAAIGSAALTPYPSFVL